jgi:DNA-directed RNA polymerase alpha subunit
MGRGDDNLSLERLIETGRFSRRALGWLITKERITRLDQLARLTRKELLSMPGIGPGNLARLEAILADHNLSLSPSQSKTRKHK